MLIMSYYNPLLRYGLEKLAHDAAASGFDGILASDLTVEESGLIPQSHEAIAGLNTVFLVAPTSSPERIRQDRRNLHRVSLCCLAHRRYRRTAGTLNRASRLPANSPEPHARFPSQSALEYRGRNIVQAVWQEADGAVVGSALVREIEEHSAGGDVADQVAVFTRWLKGAAA